MTRFAVITLPNTAVASGLRPDDLPDYRYSIISWDIAQQGNHPSFYPNVPSSWGRAAPTGER